MADSPLRFSNNGAHRPGAYRFLVHLPMLDAPMPKFYILGYEFALEPLETPGWYLSKEFNLADVSNYRFGFLYDDGQPVVADAIFALWKDPILTK
jgi:hypothetical protein